MYSKSPWRVIINDAGDEFTGWPLCIATSEENEDICATSFGGNSPYQFGDAISMREACANAALMAAAPDMYEAIVTFRGLHGTDDEALERLLHRDRTVGDAVPTNVRVLRPNFGEQEYFTDGPWFVKMYGDADTEKSGWPQAIVSLDAARSPVAPGSWYSSWEGFGEIPNEQACANAQLIAAAPELYFFLKAIVASLSQGDPKLMNAESTDLLAHAKTILEKALDW